VANDSNRDNADPTASANADPPVAAKNFPTPDDLELLGREFAGYRVEQRLGQGGMGIVYRAVDVNLGRPAALKFVSPEAGWNVSGRARLLREAQAAASLNHLNICTIYAVGEAEGRLFIAMEYLEGADVRRLLKRGPLRWNQAVSICRQTARALAEAHKKNIFHRDVKTANIFLTRQDVVKLLDFGLAISTTDPSVTRSMLLLGTPGYMAPEQLEHGVANAQTDIWSLGVVLYEMLSGAHPFGSGGKSAIRSILTEDPTRITVRAPGGPSPIEDIITKALQKDPRDRYRTAEEMIADLNRADVVDETVTVSLSDFSGARHIPADSDREAPIIAVMPMLNLSSDPADEYICDGLAEELINGLAGTPGLRVVSRSSSFQLRGTVLDSRAVGSKLGASHLVNGSLRRSADQLRLTAQLTKARDGYLLWSQRFDAGMKDLFALQDELSAAVLERLRRNLLMTSASVSRSKAPAANPAAYELYLRGRHFYNQQTAEALHEALGCLSRALDLDREQAPIHIALAECHALLEWYGLEATSEALPQIKKALEDGLKLDPHSFSGLCLLATVQAGYDWDWKAAEKTFESAMAAGAGSGAVWFHYALDLLTPLGRLDEALRAIQTALELDPLSAIASTGLGGCYYRMHRWTEAEKALRTTIDLHPNFGHARWSLGRVLLEQGEGDLALQKFDEGIQVAGRSAIVLAELGHCLGRLGRHEQARRVLAEMDSIAAREFVSPISYALVFAGMNDRTSALSSLDRAFAQRARGLVWINVDPRFQSLHDEPAFQDLLDRIGLTAPEHPVS
jgi:serine/threonine-protein kinase